MAQKEYIIKEIPGYEGKYALTSDGQVVRFIKMHSNHRGAIKVTLNRKPQFVHRLVYLTFVGRIPENLEVDHINGDCTDNRLVNLRLLTRLENVRAYYKLRKQKLDRSLVK
jgi:hypothetical protein